MVQNSDGRDTTLEQSPPSLYRRQSSEPPGDQTRSGKFVSIVFSISHVLEQQSYLLSLIAMLVKLHFLCNFSFKLVDLGMEYNIS